MDHNEVFLSLLEPFIMKNSITNVPNDIFTEILYYYKQQDKLKVVQNLIVNLQLNQIDIGYTITICLELNLFTPLIYICTRKDNDFITPLYKMY